MNSKEHRHSEFHRSVNVVLISCLFVLLQLSRASACLWDKDTMAAEQARLAEAVDIITGNFPRHSREFHQWRITETKRLLEKTPTALPLYDDLAVSQHKLGDHTGAIETMKAKQKLQPGVYETYSNMGTFLIYTGELPKALEFIDKALSINPNAHFGREKYQKWLVEWVIAGKPALSDKPWSSKYGYPATGYAAFVLSKQTSPAGEAMSKELRREAIKGVVGMMRFADFDNPLLQEALGDLLCTGEVDNVSAHLTSLTYLHASQKASSPDEQLRLTKKYTAARSTFQDGMSPETLIRELNEGLAKGENLTKQVREDEIEWIGEGKNASDEFAKKYLPPEKPAEKAVQRPAR